jgi:hypothetical protein
MTADALRTLDGLRRQQDDLPGRPKAIRRLVELGLKAKPRADILVYCLRALVVQ